MNWGRLSAVQEAMRARIPVGRAGRAQGSSGPSTWRASARSAHSRRPPPRELKERPRASRSARDAGVVFTSGGSSSLRRLRLLLSRLPVRHLPRRGLPAATPRTSRPRPVTMETRRRGRGGSLERPRRVKTELQPFCYTGFIPCLGNWSFRVCPTIYKFHIHEGWDCFVHCINIHIPTSKILLGPY